MKILAVRPLADRAVTFDLADRAGPDTAARITTALGLIDAAVAAGSLPGVTETAASFSSVTLHYDCLHTDQAALVAQIRALLASADNRAPGAAGRHWTLPCCYDGDAGIDLADLSAALALPVADIIARHAATRFQVYALGFLPGLPFLGDLPADLARPRRTTPRTHVPAGSVAIANRMCVIYPWDSPGGWHIVGRCPVPLFDIARNATHPALLAVGDSVQFTPASAAECAAIAAGAARGRTDPARFLTQVV